MSESDLKLKITEDMKTAMRAKDKPRLGVIRLILAATKQREVDERITLSDDQVLTILDKMVKQRRDSITQFEAGGRQDLVDQEKFEIEIITQYLPEALSESEIDAAIKESIAAVGADSMKDMGKVMSELKPKLQGRADMGQVSQKVKQFLAG